VAWSHRVRRVALVALVGVAAVACGGGGEEAAGEPAARATLDPFQARLRILAVYHIWFNRLEAGGELPADAEAIATRTRRWIEAGHPAPLASVRVETATAPAAVRDPRAVYIYGPLTAGMFVVAAPTRAGPRFGVVDPNTQAVEVIGLSGLSEYERLLRAAIGSQAA
jgi:hypothetical protein